MTYLSERCEKLKSSVLNDTTHKVATKKRLWYCFLPKWLHPFLEIKENVEFYLQNSTILLTNIMHDGPLIILAKNRRWISPSEFFFYHISFFFATWSKFSKPRNHFIKPNFHCTFRLVKCSQWTILWAWIIVTWTLCKFESYA